MTEIKGNTMKNNTSATSTQPEKTIKREKNSFINKIRTHFKSYCNHTSIHGFQYFGQNRTIYEKCWWTIVFICIITCCAFAIFLIYDKWRKSPVIVSLTTRDTPIYQVSFPAVTICPTIKYGKEYINFSEMVNKSVTSRDDKNKTFTEEQKKLLHYMIALCKRNELTELLHEDSEDSNFSNDIYESFLTYSPLMKFGYNEIIFMDERLNFHEDFRPLLTEEGLCFTFNMLSTKDIYKDDVYIHPGFQTSGPKSFWVPQSGYTSEAELLTYPRRALLSGASNALEIKLFHRKKDIDYMCTGAEQGYKVILHHPTRIPRPGLEYNMAPYGKATIIAISPNMMATSDVVKSYNPEKRDCYFADEKELRFFKIYSKTNCQVECLTNYTLAECGCVTFDMPRDNSTEICGFWKMDCVKYARKKFNLSKLKSKLREYKELKRTRVYPNVMFAADVFNSSVKNITKRHTDSEENRIFLDDDDDDDEDDEDARCHCLRTCYDITYQGTSSTMEYNWQKESLILPIIMKPEEHDMTHITLFLNTDIIFTTERNELYGPTDFLSNFGGLLGLFSGFSILSFMEILYFCTFRILGNTKLIGRWYGDKEE